MSKKQTKKQIDIYIDQYTESHRHPLNELIQWICIPLIVFSLLGLVWAIPFPYIPFLHKYNVYINWASFVIAFAIYYYYRLSPVLSYGMLLLIFLFTYIIQQLKLWQLAGGPQLWQTCLLIFILACAGQFTGYLLEGKKTSFLDVIKLLLIGPIWLLHFILIRFKIRY